MLSIREPCLFIIGEGFFGPPTMLLLLANCVNYDHFSQPHTFWV